MQKLLLLPVALLLSSCATYDPVEVCSANWIGERADRAVDRIETDTSRVMSSLKSAGESLARGKTPGPLKMLSLSRSLKGLERELTNGRGIKDLKILANTCDDPQIVTDAFGSYLDRQGITGGLRDFIEQSGIVDQITRLAPDGDV